MRRMRTELISEWMRGDKFLREFSLSRIFVYNMNDLINHLQGVDDYLAVFSMREIFNETFDTIFFDIDSGFDGLVKFMSQVKLPPSRLYFSGNKGFHVYYDLKKPIVGHKLYSLASKLIVNKYNLKDIIDNSVVGDVRRIARLVGTVNSKSGKYMIKLNSGGNYSSDEILKLAVDNKSADVGGVQKYEISEIVDINEIKNVAETDSYVFIKGKIFRRYAEYPKCIHNAMVSLLNTGELNHVERLVLAGFLLANDDEDLLRWILKFAHDYDSHYTNYQIEYLKRKQFKIYKCANIPSTICPYSDKKKCPYYPSLNMIFRAGDKND